ncbi:thiamine phosphate synthase [Sulfurimonas diazotrophicus]|uniref:Thiamine phosphate synthase n=1 Tax=Sulfurimonas diazotrophicus TaxID=3131939 RepID=A0ABZ3HEA1_9BACT
MTRSEIDAFFTSLPSNALYALCDQALLDSHALELEPYVEACRRLDVSLIQYRNKAAETDAVTAALERLRGLWDGMLIINDRWQLHALCDGVHVGQDDLLGFGADAAAAAQSLRGEVGGDCVIGLSTHNATEIATANTLGIDYIGLGAFRATGTKTDAAVLGEDLDTLAAASVHPVAAIGGVGFEDRFTHARMRVMGSAIIAEAQRWK